MDTVPDVPLMTTAIAGYPCRRGKVRDIYDLGDRLVIIATDRISAFDWVLPTGIPHKGRILTALTCFWLRWLQVPHHLLSVDVEDLPEPFRRPELAGRVMLVVKTAVIPIECVARGYLAGSGWKEYCQRGTVCDIPLPAGLRLADRLPEPIFTPATKEEGGRHDENISFEQMQARVGRELAEELRRRTLDIYQRAADYAQQRGLILADTKLEFGRRSDGTLLLIDEVLTPDSSRFWPQQSYTVGSSPPSFDKQYVRDWLEQCGWDKQSPPPPLPPEVVARTAARYREAFHRITGWKDWPGLPAEAAPA
jgi:phosphoribosylaminoimidazole-succinocarboxamide synthase